MHAERFLSPAHSALRALYKANFGSHLIQIFLATNLSFFKMKYYLAFKNNKSKGRFSVWSRDKQLKVPPRASPSTLLGPWDTSTDPKGPGIIGWKLWSQKPAGLLSSVAQVSTAQFQARMWMSSLGGKQCSSPWGHVGTQASQVGLEKMINSN